MKIHWLRPISAQLQEALFVGIHEIQCDESEGIGMKECPRIQPYVSACYTRCLQTGFAILVTQHQERAYWIIGKEPWRQNGSLWKADVVSWHL
jgi:hypothetical protein